MPGQQYTVPTCAVHVTLMRALSARARPTTYVNHLMLLTY